LFRLQSKGAQQCNKERIGVKFDDSYSDDWLGIPKLWALTLIKILNIRTK